jgi:hypothetical protein
MRAADLRNNLVLPAISMDQGYRKNVLNHRLCLKSASVSINRMTMPPTRSQQLALSWLVCGAILLCTTGCEDTLTFPGAVFQGNPLAHIDAPPGCEVVRLNTRDGVPVTALFGIAQLPDGRADPKPELRPTLLYFYGNGTAIAFEMREFQEFRRLDANVLTPDYVGYGMSSGRPSESGFYATADAAYDHLVQSRHVAAEKIVAVGWSIGGAVAIDLASRRKVVACAVFNPFVNSNEMAHRWVPFLPASIVSKYHFDNLQKIRLLSCPIFICNGLQDMLVPATMSDRLAAAAGGPVTRVRVKAAGHSDIFSADPNAVFPPFGKFLQSVPGLSS